jgi:Ni,Fe-hydrogenase III small subunit
MQNYSSTELRLIYKALKVYQVNNATLSSGEYNQCDLLLRKLFSYVYDIPQSYINPE